jgi:hypothetical protein
MASEVIERKLYKGQYHMVHNPNARGRAARYTVTDTKTGEITKPKGVTTILGQTLAKDLMQWAVDCACEYLETKLPVITGEDLKTAADQYKVKRDAGGSTGTEAHALVEGYLKGSIPAIDSSSKEAINAYLAFVKWFEEVKPKVLNVEEVIFSREFQYAGTYDCMLEIDGKVYLCDLKTTNASRKAPNGVYAENFLQLGAYAAAHEEQRKIDTSLPEIEGLMVISAKKNGKLDICTESDVGLGLADCMSMFKRVFNLYSFLNYTTEQLGGK